MLVRIKNAWNTFLGWFRKKPQPVEVPQETQEPIPQPTMTHSDSIGIIVGHNNSSSGAVNYLGESEYTFNSRIALKLKRKLEDFVNVSIYKRPSGSYSHQVNSITNQLANCMHKAVISLHFNSAGPSARGCEVLIPSTPSPRDNELADAITDELNEKLGISERRDDGVFVISRSHRGASMAYKVNSMGFTFCLVEPCFGDTRTSESIKIFENEDSYVDALAVSILRFLANL